MVLNIEKLFDEKSDDPLVKERAMCILKECDIRKLINELNTCTKRIESKSYTAETCHQEVCDLMEAIDHCVGAKGFLQLK